MAMKGKVDKIYSNRYIQIEEFEWKIANYSSLPGQHITSPMFSFAGTDWYLWMYPKGTKRNETTGFLDLYLHRSTSGHPVYLEYWLGLKTVDGKKDSESHCSFVFEKANDNFGTPKIISRTELFKRKSDFLPSDVLSVFCKMIYPQYTEAASVYYRLPLKVASEKCSYCKTSLDSTEDISSHQRKCMDKPIKCPECGDVIILKNWYDHECQKAGAKATEKFAATKNLASCEKLCNDLERIMLSGDHSDTSIRVKGEEFTLHKSILGARSPFFDSMFKTQMRENITGIVSIDDCEPDIFRSYIHFVYTGKVDKLSAENVCDLYVVADKYQEDQLKDECLQFMMNSISIDSFCDYTILAISHDQEKLLKNTTKFFACKTKEIIKSAQWQNFLLKYPIQANELHIKALDHDFAT